MRGLKKLSKLTFNLYANNPVNCSKIQIQFKIQFKITNNIHQNDSSKPHSRDIKLYTKEKSVMLRNKTDGPSLSNNLFSNYVIHLQQLAKLLWRPKSFFFFLSLNIDYHLIAIPTYFLSPSTSLLNNLVSYLKTEKSA